MLASLLLSTLIAGSVAIAVMLAILYLPLLWGGRTYDVLNALGAAVTRRVDGRSLAIGFVLYAIGGFVFALLYGLVAQPIVMAEATGGIELPDLLVAGAGSLDLTYLLIGMALGLAHGGIVALLVTIVVIEHHPLERFRDRYALVRSQFLGHIVFGATVMLMHSRLLTTV